MTSVQVYATVHNTPMPYIVLYNIWIAEVVALTLVKPLCVSGAIRGRPHGDLSENLES